MRHQRDTYTGQMIWAYGNRDVRRWVDPGGLKRTKQDWPYAYSEFYLWGTPRSDDVAVYSDRLFQWDNVAWERSNEAVPGKRFDQMSKADADKFMSAYYEKPIDVSALAEGCNVSNGYPYWILWYREKPAMD